MAPIVDRALLLRRFPYGESSLVCHALTRTHGRVHWLAKGAYRPSSRYYGVLDLFDTLEVSWNERPGVELQLLTAASLERRRASISRDLGFYRAALVVLELATLAAPEGHSDPRLFELVERALDDFASGAPADAVLVEFELSFLQNLGLAPALVVCASCGGSAPSFEASPGEGPRVAFSSGAGGRLCRSCAAQARAVGRRVGTLPLAVLERADAILAGRARASAYDVRELDRTRDFVARFLEFHLERRPAGYRSFLAVPNRNRPPE
ncbi:MAG: DNA repair protein RecO [Planctomycetes bacterium]|nr:DNA repair protein RecO [Planctomycetota bacterium]